MTVPSSALVDDVAGELCDAHVGCVVVVDENAPVGVVTDRDISVKLDANWVDTSQVTVDEVLDGDVVTVDADASLAELSELMYEHDVRRVPVVEETELVGIVTQDDLVVYVAGILENLAAVIRDESPPERWGRAY